MHLWVWLGLVPVVLESFDSSGVVIQTLVEVDDVVACLFDVGSALGHLLIAEGAEEVLLLQSLAEVEDNVLFELGDG